MAMDPNCPCTRDCPDRNVAYCKNCKRGNEWKNKQLEKYNAANPDRDFKVYLQAKSNKDAIRYGKFHKNRYVRR